jgi:hypothetical protein
MTRRSILSAAVAVLGLALSAALAWSASQLAGQRIGLASEPLSVAQGLAPHHRAGPAQPPRRDDRGAVGRTPTPRKTSATTRTQIFTTPAPVTPVAPATTAAPASTSAPPAPTSTTAAAPGTSGQSSASNPGHGDGHHPDD